MRQSRKSVLLVEDHPRRLLALRKLFASLDFEVVVAGDGAATKEAVDRFVPDLICIELRLPDSSGYELCELIRSSPAHRDVPVVLLSDDASPGDRAHAHEVEADALLVRPLVEEQLRARLPQLLRRPGPALARAAGGS